MVAFLQGGGHGVYSQRPCLGPSESHQHICSRQELVSNPQSNARVLSVSQKTI